ncbi:MAG: hypothetical protein ACYCYP_02680 [Leptospirales bacterium]
MRKKPEQVQVRVNRFMLAVKGNFDPGKMEEAARILSAILDRTGSSDSGSPQSIQSLALLAALEKIYENRELEKKIMELEETLDRRDRFIGQLDSSIAELEQNAESLLREKR